MGLKYWFHSLREFVLDMMSGRESGWGSRNLIDNHLKTDFQYQLHKNQSLKKKKVFPFFLFFFWFFSFDRLFYLLSLSNIWILASGAAHSTEQAWLWLGELWDLWWRLIALCCVWDSAALRRPTKITILSPPLHPRFQSSLWLIEENCPPPYSPLRLLLSPAKDNKNHKVMWLLWLQENVGL